MGAQTVHDNSVEQINSALFSLSNTVDGKSGKATFKTPTSDVEASAGTVYYDSSYLYIRTADKLGKNLSWKKIALSDL